MEYSSDIGFTDTVKALQTRKGSREAYAKMEARGGWQTRISEDLAQVLVRTRSFFLATSNASGQPYIQHRGGPPGFLKVIDENTFGFANFKGNQQFISQGNLQDNNKAFAFFIDYATQTRIKVWGHAMVVEDDQALVESFMPAANDYRARANQLMLFKVSAWDRNCPQHIPQRYDKEDVDLMIHEAVAAKEERIAELEKRIAQLES